MTEITKSPAPVTAGDPHRFTERELQLLGWAMQSLKSGPPEIDNEKLASFAGMSNPRSAGNAWANLKKKLMAPSDGSAPPTPKKAVPRKKAVKDDASEDAEANPKKTPRKRVNKEIEDGDASPKKRGRPAKPKSREEPEAETSEAKTDSDSADESKPVRGAAMAKADEEDEEDEDEDEDDDA